MGDPPPPIHFPYTTTPQIAMVVWHCIKEADIGCLGGPTFSWIFVVVIFWDRIGSQKTAHIGTVTFVYHVS